MRRINVLVADDSEFWLRHLPPALERDPGIRVVGTASGVRSGLAKYLDLRPDVVVADIFLGGTDRSLVRKLVRGHHACVVCMGGESREKDVAAEACRLGLRSELKPPAMVCVGLGAFTHRLIAGIKAAYASAESENNGGQAEGVQAEVENESSLSSSGRRWSDAFEVVALAASTGGTQALEDVLAGLPKDFPAGLLIVQHLSNGLSGALAERLEERSPLRVEVVDRPKRVRPGVALLARDGRHLKVRRDASGLEAYPDDSAHLTLYRPSADVFFSSVAETCGARAVAVVLTGMGNDGCRGLLKLKVRGGLILAQDADSSVVFGMPGAAIACGAADVAVPLDEMAAEIIDRCSRAEPALDPS